MRLSDSVWADYEKESDEVLITRLRDGETVIEEYLLVKYKNLVKSKAGRMFLLGAEPEDLIQEGTIGMIKAIRDYDHGRDASFFTFADLCVSRAMYNAVTSSGRQKNIPLNNYVSLYSETGGDDGGTQLRETLPDKDGSNPESILIDRENVERINGIIEKDLSEFEKQVLELHMIGMTYSEIARMLGKDDKSTDNALTRAKQKISKGLGRRSKKKKSE